MATPQHTKSRSASFGPTEQDALLHCPPTRTSTGIATPRPTHLLPRRRSSNFKRWLSTIDIARLTVCMLGVQFTCKLLCCCGCCGCGGGGGTYFPTHHNANTPASTLNEKAITEVVNSRMRGFTFICAPILVFVSLVRTFTFSTKKKKLCHYQRTLTLRSSIGFHPSSQLPFSLQ